jgi:CRISPR system Cascade subunit CasB
MSQNELRVQPLIRLAQIIAAPPRFTNDPSALDNGERAALARLDPEAMRAHQVAALARALLAAGIDPAEWRGGTWQRWALIAHGMALAGHDADHSLGAQLCEAGVSESRVTKLLTSRDVAFRQIIPRILRLLASRSVKPNWQELGALILNEGRDETKTEQVRLTIASRYFSALAKKTAVQ